MDKIKTKQQQSGINEVFDISESELESTLESYLEDEEKEEKPRLLNFLSLSGLAMLMVGFVAMIQLILPNVDVDVIGPLSVLPIFGGILVLLYGLGLVGGERKNKKHKNNKNKELKAKTMARYSSEIRGMDNKMDSFALKKKKKLFKSITDKKFLGVCGGIAENFGIDATLIRIIFVVSFFIGSGTPLLIYLALGLILDKEPPVLTE